MHCRFCGYSNREGDVRCARCDGRLQPPVVTGRSSAVPVENDDTQAVQTQSVPAAPPADRQRKGPPRQAALFENNVISFPGPATRAMRAVRPAPGTAERQKPSAAPTKRATAERKAPPPPRTGATQSTRSLSDTILSATQERLLGISGQQMLDLASHDTQAASVCRSECPVAPPSLRVKAAAIDATLIGVALALSVVPFYMAGGQVGASTKALLGFGAYAVVLALFYEIFWCVLKRESFGVARQRMRLVNFEGDAPAAGKRWARLGAVILGAMAAGLGLFWALLDQEKLAWHDHMSGTYPTVKNPNPGTFRRG